MRDKVPSGPPATLDEKRPLASSAMPNARRSSTGLVQGPAGAAATLEAAHAAGAAAPAADQHLSEPTHPGVPLAPPDIAPESDVRLHSPAAARPPPHKETGENIGELPWAYGDGRLVALVRDPVTLFVYWDLSQQQIDQGFHDLGPSRAMLRLWNARKANDLVRETDVRLDARAWYVRELPAGTEVRAELWAVGERGSRRLRAARPVRLPPELPSEQLEAFYLRLDLGQPLPRDGVASARALSVVGGAPAAWDRRDQPRHQGVNRSSSRMPWSAIHVPDPKADDEDGK